MKEYNVVGLRGMLEDFPTAELNQMLDSELLKDKPDPFAVKLIMSVLEERDSEAPKVRSAQSEDARRKYRERMEELFPPEPKRRWKPLLRVASVILVVGLIFSVVPQKAEAETFWEMLQRLSTTVIEYFDRDDKFAGIKYTFKTDNEGLQQVYDAVVELGITEPVVPMWLPEGYKIIDHGSKNTPMQKVVWAWFSCDNNEIIYRLDLYEGEPAHQYYIDDTHYETYERNGTIYNITRSNDRWGAVWTKDNIECSIILDCQEDTLRRILKSIYVMEDN